MRLEPLEWDTQKIICNLLNCEVNQLKRIVCYRDIYGRIKCYEDIYKTTTCVVTLRKETDKKRLAMLGVHF